MPVRVCFSLLLRLGSVWGVSEEYGNVDRCRAFMSIPGPLHSVQRAEFWGAIMALQAYYICHLGIDNINVSRTVGRLLDHGSLSKPFPLVKDVDLGRVRLEDRLENMEADAAADLGRMHQDAGKVDARRSLLGARDLWYPIVLQFHRFMFLRIMMIVGETWGILVCPIWKSFVLFESWIGHRLLSGRVTRTELRPHRSISLPSALVLEGIEIRCFGLAGTLKLRYCTIPFSKHLPPWIISGSHGQGGG